MNATGEPGEPPFPRRRPRRDLTFVPEQPAPQDAVDQEAGTEVLHLPDTEVVRLPDPDVVRLPNTEVVRLPESAALTSVGAPTGPAPRRRLGATTGVALLKVPTQPAPAVTPRRVVGPAAAPGGSREQVLAVVGVAVSALRILSVLLLAFVGHVAVLGGITHDRDQAVLYDQVRESLARGEAPLGQTDLEGRLLAPGTPLGLIEVPALGLQQVMVEGTSSKELESAPGHRRDTVLPGQAGVSLVMGRQAGFGGPFGRITELRVGHQVVVTTGQGRHEFQVFAVRGAGDPSPTPPAPGTGRLTLITGDGWSFLPRDVLRVDASLVTPVVPAAPRVVTAAQLDPSELAMAGSTQAYVPLLLWGQLFLAAVALTSWTRLRWGRWQTWVVSVPVLGALYLQVADQVARLLPNLL